MFADPSVIRSAGKEYEAASLAGALTPVSSQDVLRKIIRSDTSRFVWLARDLAEEAAERFRSVKADDRRGLGLLREPKRVYPAGHCAGHVLGAVSIDGIGLEGLELQYNRLLTGENGAEQFIRDRWGRKIWLKRKHYKPAKNGRNIILTIDAVMQEFTETVLDDTCRKFRANSGCAILMDPTTGDILAWACWPKVDPNRFNTYSADHRRNRGITDPFEPGSIFKPFVAVAALKNKVVDLEEQIFCHNGAYTIGRRVLHDYHPYGDLTFAKIVIKSSNIGMAILGQRLGNDRLYQAVSAFGFGRKTGIDLPGESAGIVRPLAKWDQYTTTSVPMGQELAATAIQLITGFAAFANDGVLLQPRLLRAVIDPSGRVVRDNTAIRPTGRAVDPHLAQFMVREILARVVSDGTGKRAIIPRYSVFGKTGTAQIAKRGGGGYRSGAYVASFLGGVPSSGPKLVALVTIREPDRRIGHFGGTVAAPAVKSILEQAVKYLGIPPDRPAKPVETIPVDTG